MKELWLKGWQELSKRPNALKRIKRRFNTLWLKGWQAILKTKNSFQPVVVVPPPPSSFPTPVMIVLWVVSLIAAFVIARITVKPTSTTASGDNIELRTAA